jgi:hypothetical protein
VGILSGLKRLFSEAEEPVRLTEGNGQTVDPDDELWTRLTGDGERDLDTLSQERMRTVAVYLWDANVIANRIVELPIAYILGEGARLSANDEALQSVLDGFWRHPINAMDKKLPIKVRELSLYGEQIWPVFVNEVSGQVQLGYIHPSRLKEVVVDPDNPDQPVGLVVTKGVMEKELRYRVVVNGPEALFTQRTQALRQAFTDGDVFYFAVNTLSTTRRGRSDLRAPADWLDAYDQFLFGELERYNFLRAFVWDVTVAGADDTKIREKARSIKAPTPGSVRVHNESEVWKAETPDLQAADTSNGARLFRNHVLGAASIPEHWFGGGGDVNLATAAEMGGPTYKMFSMRQREIRHMLEEVGRFVIRQSILAKEGREPDWTDPRLKVQVVFPEMIPSDTTKYAAALSQVAAACVTSMEAGLLGEAAAVGLLATVAGRLGYELDPDAELAAARERKKRRAEEDSFKEPDLAAEAERMKNGGAVIEKGAP